MKVLFISDIHGITINLEVINKILKTENIDKFVVLGDLYYPGPLYENSESISSKIVKDFLTSYSDKIICLKGNCDSNVDIKSSDFLICEGPVLLNIDEIDIFCTHGDVYNIDNARKLNKNSVLVYGHNHYPFIEKKEGKIFINTGSISLPRNGSKPSYLIFENRKFTLYDISGSIIDFINI